MEVEETDTSGTMGGSNKGTRNNTGLDVERSVVPERNNHNTVAEWEYLPAHFSHCSNDKTGLGSGRDVVPIRYYVGNRDSTADHRQDGQNGGSICGGYGFHDRRANGESNGRIASAS